MAVSAVIHMRLWATPSWMRRASCAGAADPDWWFPERGEHRAAGQLAIMICQECPVRAQCLEYALQGREYGIWGGLTEEQRKTPLARRRPRRNTVS